MKKILVISWFFPPINSSEGLVTYKLLANSSLSYDVFMQENSASWSYGKNDNFPEVTNVNKIYAQSDNLDMWVNEGVEYFRKHQKEYDIVMTRSMPPESHQIGLEIKKIKPTVKWIASFGDPIANNPFTLKGINKISPYSLENRYIRKMSVREMISPMRMIRNSVWKIRMERERKPYEEERKLQKEIIENCDYVILNSDEQKEYMCTGYEPKLKEKAVILPHSYDKNLYEKVPRNVIGKTRIVYVGHLDDIRTPHVFLKALKKLKSEDIHLADKLEVVFYGNMSGKEKVYLLDNELLDIVQIKKTISYLESLKVMQDADWLLHIDANIQDVLERNIFFAAKLADYIGAGTPIMGITMTEGPSADILRKMNALIMSYSVDEIKNYLYLIVNEGYHVDMNEEYAKEFDAVRVAGKFDKMIEEMK